MALGQVNVPGAAGMDAVEAKQAAQAAKEAAEAAQRTAESAGKTADAAMQKAADAETAAVLAGYGLKVYGESQIELLELSLIHI